MIRIGLFTVVFAFAGSTWAAVSALESTISNSDRNFWASAFSLTTVDGEALQDGGAGFFMYNYASFNFLVTDNSHVALRVPFMYQSAGFDTFNDTNQEQEIQLGDVIVDYTAPVFLLPGDIETFHRYRIELPTSDSSRLQKKIGTAEVTLIMSKNINRDLELEYWPQFEWNVHTQTVYPNPDIGNSLSHTTRYELDQRLTLWYRPPSRFALGFFVGTEDSWLNESKVNLTRRQQDGRLAEHFLKLGPALRFTLNRNFSFLLNVSNTVPMWGFTADRAGTASDLGKFQAEYTSFALLSFINF